MKLTETFQQPQTYCEDTDVNFVTPSKQKKIVVYNKLQGNHSLIHPFYINCVIFYQYPSTHYTSKFHDLHDNYCVASCGFTFSTVGAENIPVVVTVIIIQFLIESSMLFSVKKIIQASFIYKTFLSSYSWTKAILICFNGFIVCSLTCSLFEVWEHLLLYAKNHTSTYGYSTNYTKDINIAIKKSICRVHSYLEKR